MSERVAERARTIVAQVLGLPAEAVTMATTSASVENWDSLNVLNILMAVEGEFGISIDPDDVANFVSVEKIVSVVESKLPA